MLHMTFEFKSLLLQWQRVNKIYLYVTKVRAALSSSYALLIEYGESHSTIYIVTPL